MTLRTVKVPEPLAPLFERAEALVSAYFDAMRREPESGVIDIFGSRYVMLRGASLSIEFFQLVRRIYGEAARDEADSFAAGLLYDLAYAVGKADASNFHDKMKLHDPLEKLSAGPVHFAHAGWAHVNIDAASTPATDSSYVIHYTHPYSFEADAWLDAGETAPLPICVMNAGYSAGWCEQSFGLILESREISCRGCGDEECRFVMAPPGQLNDRIHEYLAAHSDRSYQLGSLVRTGLLADHGSDDGAGNEALRQELSGRLLGYARKLEAAQSELHATVEELHHEIAERKAIEHRLQRLASEDDLTGLLSRNAFLARIDQFVHASERLRGVTGKAALMFVDLDNFKDVNDTLGHDVGDRLLIDIGRKLRDNVEERDTVARLGGDEFAVWIEGLVADHTVGIIAERILGMFTIPTILEGHEIHVTPSIGIALYPEDGDSATTLLRHADLAMYHAKSSGRNNYQYFTAAMNQRVQERLALEREMRLALPLLQFSVQYQLRFAASSGRPCGMEALARWHHPQRGMISPAVFIPIAEETGLILTLGEQVLTEACRQCRVWLDRGLDPGRISVNLSPRQFRHENLADQVTRILRTAGLPADRVELEITEGAVMEDTAAAIDIMRALKAVGVKLSIDDFGTGYSSLSYLRQFPVDSLKIDRSFIIGLRSADEQGARLLRSIIDLAHSLDLGVVAEGVEDAQQLQLLRELNCEEVQGYLLARPEDAAVVEARLR